MAVTKVLNIGDCGNGYHGKHLKAAIDYIKNEEKTDGGRLVGGINCQPDFAYDKMKNTKVKFGKIDKRQAYHFIISFEEDNIDDDTAFKITERFAKEYIGDDYEVIFSVHNNTKHKHGHIIFNSVNIKNGKKYRYEKGDWAKYIQPLTNSLCKEYGLSTIDINYDKKEKDERYKEWNTYRDGKFVWKDMVIRDVDSCILQASTYDTFLEMLKEKGYKIKQEKYMAVLMPGMKKYAIVLIDCHNLPSLLFAVAFQHIPLVGNTGALPVKVIVFGKPAIDGRPEAARQNCVHACVFVSVHHNRLPAQSRRNTVLLNLVFIISQILCFRKIFLAGILPIFLGNQAHKDIRCVQLAVKNCGNMNLCFRFCHRQLSSIIE